MTRGRANVLIAAPIDVDTLTALRGAAPDCMIDSIDPFPPDTTLPEAMIRERTVLVSDHPPANITSMEQLEWFQLGSAGYMQLSGLPLEAMGVRVTNASGVNDVPIAEWCLPDDDDDVRARDGGHAASSGCGAGTDARDSSPSCGAGGWGSLDMATSGARWRGSAARSNSRSGR
jgi:hypothetical protein